LIELPCVANYSIFSDKQTEFSLSYSLSLQSKKSKVDKTASLFYSALMDTILDKLFTACGYFTGTGGEQTLLFTHLQFGAGADRIFNKEFHCD
jgi:hypothetical protein